MRARYLARGADPRTPDRSGVWGSALLCFAGLVTTRARADETLPTSTAEENRFTEGRYELTHDDAQLVLSASAEPGDARVLTSPGFVRIWFASMPGDLFLDPPVDGQLFRWVQVRPGMNGSTLVKMRVGDTRRLPTEAVRVERGANGARIRIARSLLPQLPPPPPPEPVAPPVAAPPAAPTPSVEAPAAATPAASTTSTTLAPAAQQARPDSAHPEALAIAAPATSRPAASAFRFPFSGSANEDAESDAEEEEQESGVTGGMSVMILVSALLLGLYFFIRMIAKRRGLKPTASDIQVISTKRLGTKHQILVIRALGEDHLVSISAARTDVIASAPAHKSESHVASAAPESTARVPAAQKARMQGLLARFQQTLNPTRAVLDTLNDDSPLEDDRPRRAPTSVGSERVRGACNGERFGSEFMRFTAKQRPANEGEESTDADESAIAGIIRLRERFGRS